MAQLDVRLTGYQEVQPPPGRQHSFVEIDHGILSMGILSILLLSVFGKRICAVPVNCLED